MEKILAVILSILCTEPYLTVDARGRGRGGGGGRPVDPAAAKRVTTALLIVFCILLVGAVAFYMVVYVVGKFEDYRNRPRSEWPIVIGALVACILLPLATLSAIIFEGISFFDMKNPSGNTTHYGVFGYTGSERSVGYHITAEMLEIPNETLGTVVISGLTYALILHPIAAGFAFSAVLFGTIGSFTRGVSGGAWSSIFSDIAATLTLIVWVIDMIIWGVARNLVRSSGTEGFEAEFGNANWLVLGAFVALFTGNCIRTRSSVKVWRHLIKK